MLLLSDKASWGVVATAAAIAVGAVYLVRARSKRQGKLAPGPKGALPFIGHALYFVKPDYHRHLTKWANEFGGIYRVNLGGNTYVISDAQLVNTILMTRGEGKFLKSRQVYDPSFELSYDSPSIFNDSEEGEYYYTWRKAILQCFSNDNLKAIFPTIRGCADMLVAEWAKVQATGAAADLEDWMQRCFLDIASDAGFARPGTALTGGPNEFLHVVHDTLALVNQKMANPAVGTYYKLFPFTKAARNCRSTLVKFRSLFDGLLEEFRARGLPAEDDMRMWAQIMRITDPSTGKPYPDRIISGQIATLLVAGYDTSSWTSIWALYDIARHPDIQKRIVRELAGVGLLQVPGKSPARQLEWADLTLPYFNAVVKESMRMHPVGATGTMRVAPRDMEIGGYSILKGEKLWVPMLSIHNSNINFSEPSKFDPERWMKMEEKGNDGGCPAAPAPLPNIAASCPFSSKATYTGHAEAPTSVLPFSAGQRNCVGISFAYATLRTVLLSVLSNFWLELDPSVGTHAEVEAAQAMALVLTSGRPLKVLLHPHAAA